MWCPGNPSLFHRPGVLSTVPLINQKPHSQIVIRSFSFTTFQIYILQMSEKRGLSVQKIILLLICFSLCVPSLFADDSDTTYGRIRIKKRDTSSSGSESGGSNDEPFFTSCMESCVSGMFDGCLDGIFHNDGQTTITLNGDQSDDRQPPKEKTVHKYSVEPCGYSSSHLHFTCGATMGGLIYSKGIAGGFILGGTTGMTWFPDTFLGVRLALEPTAAFDNILEDMERDVFVNGKQVGTTVFSGEHGKEFILPLTTQILLVPSVTDRSMFISFGGGLCYKKEIVWGKRTLNGNKSDRTITFEQWCPVFHIGLGFYIPLDRIFGILEFSYSIMANENHNRFETPGDNSRYGHMPGVSFSISTP
jgi:hypothetical protein